MQETELDILYEDGPCLVFNKPSGLPTQAPPGIDCLEVRIKRMLGRRTGRAAAEVYLGVPHRLDRTASGAIVFCTRRRPTRRLAEQFERRLVKKWYWAAVEGQVAPAEGLWEDHLRKIYGVPRAEIVPPDHPEGRLAVLHYRVLAAGAFGSLLEIRLETGRTHQVRVQAASRGHPLLGDALYGSAIPFGPHYEDQRLRAIALHARCLEFRHPVSKQWISVTAPAGKAWKEIIGE
jgi:23S rRNA pseudouridine1911/1915/1917 synthase